MLNKKHLIIAVGIASMLSSVTAKTQDKPTHNVIKVGFNEKSTNEKEISDRFVSEKNLRFRDFNRNGKLDIYEDYRNPIEQRAKDLLSKMTAEEKLAQLKCPWTQKMRIYPDNKFSRIEAMEMFPNGLGEIMRISDGTAEFGNNKEKTLTPKELAAITNETQQFFINETRLGIPVLFLEEALHGLVIKNGTMYPSALGLSSSWNEALISEVYQSVAIEGRAVGIHNVLAPVLDVALDPRWGRTEETMGEDPYLVSRLGVAIVKALQGNSGNPDLNHVAATLKHLGAHGQPEGGINIGPTFISERQLREVNFKPFKAAITEGKALGVMPNYNEISGIPTHANKWILTDVLRNEWGFNGVVISDYGATPELKDVHRIAANEMEAGVKALDAGVDMELVDKFMYSGLPEAIDKGLTSKENLNKAVLHVLELKFRLGIFDNPYIDTNKTEIVGSKEHRDLALKAARQSMVLLKNEDKLLPLDRSKYKKVAIIGPNADKCILGGYSHQPKTTISPLFAIKEKYKDVEVVYAEGCQLNYPTKTIFAPTKLIPREENLKLIRQAVNVAKDADVIVLMLGGNDVISKEAVSPFFPGDLTNLELIGQQNELVDSLKTLNKPMAAFVFSGPPISFVNLNNSVSSIVQCWYLGQETGYAVAETLFGDNNPSGKLSISIPRSAGHLPAYYYAKPSARAKGYNLDKTTPLYPFGFGLSYTEFEYSNLQISKSTNTPNENTTITIDVKNTGKLIGDEIVQLYIRDEVSSITRPVKELKDFKRISLNPGETKTVSFTITPDKLKFYDINMKEVMEPGEFTIMVGTSSEKHTSVKINR